MIDAPEKIRLFNEQARVEGGALVGSWTDDLPADMVPEAERIYVPATKADEWKRQRDRLLVAAKKLLDENFSRGGITMWTDGERETHAAIAECERKADGN